jgi:hypothetical protein
LRFVSQHWAWPAFVLIAIVNTLFRLQIRANTTWLLSDAVLIGAVVFFGWPQLARGTSSRIYFGGILIVLAFILLFAVGLLLIPLLLLYMIIDLFFIAPRRGTD